MAMVFFFFLKGIFQQFYWARTSLDDAWWIKKMQGDNWISILHATINNWEDLDTTFSSYWLKFSPTVG